MKVLLKTFIFFTQLIFSINFTNTKTYFLPQETEAFFRKYQQLKQKENF